jgi:diguanylate cyclase (GGDEF)-like protein
MKPTWKHIYPWITAAVSHLDSVDSLCRKIVSLVAKHYHAEGLLWVDLATGMSDSMHVYATAGAQILFTDIFTDTVDRVATGAIASTHETLSEQGVWQFYPQTIPTWLDEQHQTPQITQLDTGDLIIPVVSRGSLEETGLTGMIPPLGHLQFVLQLRRQPTSLPPTNTAQARLPKSTNLVAQTSPHKTATTHPWTLEELETLEIICSQLGLAYSALHWRQRLEQSRQQAALVGRIARLLNSSLNPDEIVGRIVAELGQGLQCDRCILVDLRYDPVNVLAIWDHPEQPLPFLQQRQIDPLLWRNVIEMFLQGGASYLQIALTDIDPDPLLDWLHTVGAISVLMVPLFTQENFFGAVALLSYQRQRVYQLDELQTVRQIADQAAIALTNAQHYQSLWHRQEALRMQNYSLQREVIRDELTQLLNRRSLERELERLSTHSTWAIQSAFSVIVCDIDYFKLVNDTHGHRIGDEVLQTIAQRLQKQLRRETPAYRYGGEEFVVVLMETQLAVAVDVAERLRQAIRSNPIQTSIGALDVTASFGVAQQDATRDQEAWDVLHRADQALYEAKRQGRDRIKAL